MIVTVKHKQSLFDITVQNYGNMDNLVSDSNANGIPISDVLNTNQSLIINNENKGDQEIKDKIITQKLSFNNNFNGVPVITYLEDGMFLEDGDILGDE